jgi:hypothetical protein
VVVEMPMEPGPVRPSSTQPEMRTRAPLIKLRGGREGGRVGERASAMAQQHSVECSMGGQSVTVQQFAALKACSEPCRATDH